LSSTTIKLWIGNASMSINGVQQPVDDETNAATLELEVGSGTRPSGRAPALAHFLTCHSLCSSYLLVRKPTWHQLCKYFSFVNQNRDES
jgi:hypothetical protein